jgi:solute carrier family 50 protein (sugar transporter)
MSLQELNPLPFIGIFANCTAWLLYGTLTKDPYVYFSNILGLPLGFWMIFTSFKWANEKVSQGSGLGLQTLCSTRC